MSGWLHCSVVRSYAKACKEISGASHISTLGLLKLVLAHESLVAGRSSCSLRHLLRRTVHHHDCSVIRCDLIFHPLRTCHLHGLRHRLHTCTHHAVFVLQLLSIVL